MRAKRYARVIKGAAGVAATAYAAYVAFTYYRYGRVERASRRQDADPLLDRFIPAPEVAECHGLRVVASTAVTFSAACDLKLQNSAVLRGIFRTRELILGSLPEQSFGQLGLIDQAKAWGWGVLAEEPRHEIVLGAVTQPWMADVVFHSLPAAEFAAFDEPGYVKIAWTLRVDGTGAEESLLRTETRAAVTDPVARAKFRRYWSFFSPGIILIRRVALRLVKAEAERRARTQSRSDA
jgi:hypothetical protein